MPGRGQARPREAGRGTLSGVVHLQVGPEVVLRLLRVLQCEREGQEGGHHPLPDAPVRGRREERRGKDLLPPVSLHRQDKERTANRPLRVNFSLHKNSNSKPLRRDGEGVSSFRHLAQAEETAARHAQRKRHLLYTRCRTCKEIGLSFTYHIAEASEGRTAPPANPRKRNPAHSLARADGKNL